jgi:hypothetical protein
VQQRAAHSLSVAHHIRSGPGSFATIDLREDLVCICVSSAGACNGFALAQTAQHVCASKMMPFMSSDKRILKVGNTRKRQERQDLKGGRFLACAKHWNIGVQMHSCRYYGSGRSPAV